MKPSTDDSRLMGACLAETSRSMVSGEELDAGRGSRSLRPSNAPSGCAGQLSLTMYAPVVVRLSAPITTPPSNWTAMMDVCSVSTPLGITQDLPRQGTFFHLPDQLTPRLTSPFFK